jgi:hypothetical protein
MKAAYSANFLGAASGFSIDPQTGMASGTTTDDYGKFLVGIACNEWREGIKINTIRKDYVITVCTDKQNVSFYPNPFKEGFYLDIFNLQGAIVKIYDIQGALILKQPLTTGHTFIDTQHLFKGAYIVKYSYQKDISSRRKWDFQIVKIIKQ